MGCGLLALALVAAPTLSSATPVPASGVPAKALTANADNPLAGHTWGVYKGKADAAWEPYANSSGADRTLLAKIALRPKAKWFGAWISSGDIGKKVDDYIANATGGDPDVLVQLTDFRLKPWEHDACNRLPTADEAASYKQWTDNFAAAIGNARAAVILQPDGPFALCEPGGSKALSHLIRYAAAELGSLPRTSVYIEAGAADWLRDNPVKAAQILVPAGVEGVRGFALNGTHYDSFRREIRFGASIVSELAQEGIPGKHFVINTSSNGRPFPGYSYKGANFDNARVCADITSRSCVTLGIPPTSDVTKPTWALNASDTALAGQYVDGYLWWGRPWLYCQADPFLMHRALQVARTTPY